MLQLSYKQWGYPLTLYSPGPSSLKQHVFSDATAHMIIMPASTALYSVLPGVLGSRDTKARTDEGAPFIRHAVCSVTGDTHPTCRCRPKKWVRPHCWSTVAARWGQGPLVEQRGTPEWSSNPHTSRGEAKTGLASFWKHLEPFGSTLGHPGLQGCWDQEWGVCGVDWFPAGQKSEENLNTAKARWFSIFTSPQILLPFSATGIKKILLGTHTEQNLTSGSKSVSESHSVMSDSLRPPWTPGISPGQSPGVGGLTLLQGIFPTQGSNPGLPHCRRILYQQGSSSKT